MNILLYLRLIVIAIMTTLGVMACTFVDGGGALNNASGGVTGTGISYAVVDSSGAFVSNAKHTAKVPSRVLDAHGMKVMIAIIRIHHC